ncbi:MAG: phosphohistidine phosphatase SixA [Cyanobium sp.]
MPLPTLLLLRHGIAEERAEGLVDAERALTAAGRRRTTETLRRAVALDLRVERLIASPLLRARQTAELAVAAGLAPALELATALAPGGDAGPLLATWLETATSPGAGAAPSSLALVGHEPDLGDLAAALIGAAPGSLPLRKAGLAQLQWWRPEHPEPDASEQALWGQWQLRLLLAPRILLA